MRFRGKKIIFNYKDSFSMDDTLRPVIYEGVKFFRNTIVGKYKDDSVMGIPSSFVARESSECDDCWEIGYLNWINVLDQIIYSFDPKNDTFDPKYDPKRTQEGFDLFAKHFNDLWW